MLSWYIVGVDTLAMPSVWNDVQRRSATLV